MWRVNIPAHPISGCGVLSSRWGIDRESLSVVASVQKYSRVTLLQRQGTLAGGSTVYKYT